MRAVVAAITVGMAFSSARAGEFVVRPIPLDETKAVFGQVESRDTVPARVRTGGTLLSRTVEEGSAVNAGDIIAVVGDEKLALQLQALDARLKALVAQLDNAKIELERGQALLSRGIAAQSRVDQLKTSADVLVNQIEAAKAERAVVVQQTIEGQVIAPKSGRVLATPSAPGAVVMPGETVAKIAAGGYFLRVALPERHAASIKQGDMVQVGSRGLDPAAQAAAPHRTGRVVKVYPELDGGRVIVDVEVDGLGDFFVGERVPVWIAVGRRDVLAVPPAAVVTRSGGDLVTLVTRDGTLEVPVVLGTVVPTPEGERVEVLTGVRADDKVVVP
jgi:RND family efflux transporter MFP subunit